MRLVRVSFVVRLSSFPLYADSPLVWFGLVCFALVWFGLLLTGTRKGSHSPHQHPLEKKKQKRELPPPRLLTMEDPKPDEQKLDDGQAKFAFDPSKKKKKKKTAKAQSSGSSAAAATTTVDSQTAAPAESPKTDVAEKQAPASDATAGTSTAAATSAASSSAPTKPRVEDVMIKPADLKEIDGSSFIALLAAGDIPWAKFKKNKGSDADRGDGWSFVFAVYPFVRL